MNSRIKLLFNVKQHLCIILTFVSFFVDAQSPEVSLSTKDVSCYGRSDGAINLIVKRGKTPYKFSWSNGASTQNISNLSKGTYTVTVTDKRGASTSASTKINEPIAVSASVETTGTTCFTSADGTVKITINGGKAPFTFLFIPENNPALIDSSSAFQINTNTLYIDTLPRLNGVLLITGLNGCTTRAPVTIPSPDPFPISFSQKNVTCPGAANGSIDLTVNKTGTSFSYLWSNGKTTQDISNLDAGKYTVTVTDKNNCTDVFKFHLINESTSYITTSLSAQGVCSGKNNGSIKLDITGGNAPYSYLWSNGDTTRNISSLGVGKYTVTITDSTGCTSSNSMEVGIASNMSAYSHSKHVKCGGASDGMVDFFVFGGAKPYTYIWSNGDTTSTITNLSGGTYYVTVKDYINCTLVDSASIEETEKISLSLEGKDASCAGRPTGSAEVKATGGTPPYFFEWSNYEKNTTKIDSITDGRYYVTVSDQNDCIAEDSIDIQREVFSVKIEGKHECNGTADGKAELLLSGGLEPYAFYWNDGIKERNRTGLSAGTYFLHVIENQGCIGRDTIILKNLNLSSQLSVKNQSKSKARDGSVKLTVTGDAPPFSFLWSTGDTTKDIKGLSAGSYFVTVTDSNGCTVTASEEVN